MIREARKDDYGRLLELCVLEGWKTQKDRPENFFAALDSSLSLVYEKDDKIVGFARAISDGHLTTYLCELVVDKEYRHQGIATSLIDEVFNRYPEGRMELLSSCDIFYEKLGFNKVGNGFRLLKH